MACVTKKCNVTPCCFRVSNEIVKSVNSTDLLYVMSIKICNNCVGAIKDVQLTLQFTNTFMYNGGFILPSDVTTTVSDGTANSLFDGVSDTNVFDASIEGPTLQCQECIDVEITVKFAHMVSDPFSINDILLVGGVGNATGNCKTSFSDPGEGFTLCPDV